MIEYGVLIPIGNSHWEFPSFIIPKKDGRVRWISEFRRLKEIIIRKPFALPTIQYIMNRRGKYKHFTKINLSMMLYCFEMDDQAKRLCVISLESGNYAYTRLPMGVNISPDVAQSYMAEMLHRIDCEYYMDDVGIWSYGSFEDHLQIVDNFLARFSEFNMKCNPLKCDWGVKETDFLVFWMNPQVIKPWREKIEAIL